MVEHLLCKQGVIGSNPIVSTSVRGALRVAGVGFGRFVGWFRHRLGWLALESVGWLAVPCGCAGRPEGCWARRCVLLLL